MRRLQEWPELDAGKQLAALGEEGLDEGGAVGGEDAGGYFGLVVEAGVGEDFKAGADRAGFGVVATVDEARDAGLDDRASTHAARLNCDVKSGGGEAVIAKDAGGFADDGDLGVGGGVGVADGAVAGAGDDLCVVDQDGADGDFACDGCGASFLKRLLHEFEIGVHD
jgi:hypothetical protein